MIQQMVVIVRVHMITPIMSTTNVFGVAMINTYEQNLCPMMCMITPVLVNAIVKTRGKRYSKWKTAKKYVVCAQLTPATVRPNPDLFQLLVMVMPTLVHVNARKSTHTVSQIKRSVQQLQHTSCILLTSVVSILLSVSLLVDLKNKCIGCQEGATHWNDKLKICQDDCCCGMVNHQDTGTCNCPDGKHLIDGECTECSTTPGEKTKLVYVTEEIDEDDVKTVSFAKDGAGEVSHKTDSREEKCVCDEPTYFTVKAIPPNEDTCLKCPTAEAPTHTRLNKKDGVCEPACKEGHVYEIPNKLLPVDGQPPDVKICRCPDNTPLLIEETCRNCPSEEEPLPTGGHVCTDAISMGSMSEEDCKNKARELAPDEGIKGYSLTGEQCSLCKTYLLQAEPTSLTWFLGLHFSVVATKDIIQRTEFKETKARTLTQQPSGVCVCPKGEWSELVQSCIACPDGQKFHEDHQLCEGTCDPETGEEWDFELMKCICKPQGGDVHIINGACRRCGKVRTLFVLENEEQNQGKCDCDGNDMAFWFDKKKFTQKDGEKDIYTSIEDPVAYDTRHEDPPGAKCEECIYPPNTYNYDFGVCEPKCANGQEPTEPEKCPAICLCPASKPHYVVDEKDQYSCTTCPGNTKWYPLPSDKFNKAAASVTQFVEIQASLGGNDLNLQYLVHVADPCRQIVGRCGCPPELPNLEDEEKGTCTKCEKNKMFDKDTKTCKPSCPYGQIVGTGENCECPPGQYVLGSEGEEKCGPCDAPQTVFDPNIPSEPNGPGTCICPSDTNTVKKEVGGIMTVICLKCVDPNPDFDKDTDRCKRQCPKPQIYYFPGSGPGESDNDEGHCACPVELPHYILVDKIPTCVKCGSTPEDRGMTEFEQLTGMQDTYPGIGKCQCPNGQEFFKVKDGKTCVPCAETGYQFNKVHETCAEMCSSEHGTIFNCLSSTYLKVFEKKISEGESASTGPGSNPKTRAECRNGQLEGSDFVLSIRPKEGTKEYIPVPEAEQERRAGNCAKIGGCTWHNHALSCLPEKEESPSMQICTCECPAAKPLMLPVVGNSNEYQCGSCDRLVVDEKNMLEKIHIGEKDARKEAELDPVKNGQVSTPIYNRSNV